MLQTVLAFVIPTVVTLSAAFYFFRQAQKSEEQGRSPRCIRNDYDYGDNREHSNSTRRRRRYDQECAVCFDNKPLVELYPCGHKNFCSGCIDKIISRDKRSCPLCRSVIKGYRDS